MFYNKTLTMTLVVSLGISSVTASDVAFTKQVLTNEFVAEGCHFADFDKDGHLDLTAGCYIWYGPDFSRRVNFTPPSVNEKGPTKTPYDPAKGYSDYFLCYTYDFNNDSWADILVYGLPGEAAHVFINPKGQAGDWEKIAIFDVADGESPDLVDLTADGKPELLVHSSIKNKLPTAPGKSGGQLGYAEIDWNNPLGKARFRPISDPDKRFFRYTHGYGHGDVNNDGRMDILDKDGWYEQPASTKEDQNWVFHPGPFCSKGGRGGAHMFAYDVNEDGRNDVITSYDGHGYGLGWFEHNADGTFTEHLIMGDKPEDNPHGVKFSQLHALRLADMNGDGLLDIVTGKRRWAHGVKGDAEPGADPVLYWFELKRENGKASYIPHLIDNDSGVGTQVTTADMNKDGKMDVIVANKKGVFVFLQK